MFTAVLGLIAGLSNVFLISFNPISYIDYTHSWFVALRWCISKHMKLCLSDA